MRKKILIALLIFTAVLAAVIAVAFVRLNIRTSNITADYSEVYEDPKYQTPVYVEGVEVITQDVSCGYAVIEMFSGFNGGDLTEEDLYSEYGKVVTSTGASFCDEMNKRFPEYSTSMHSYLTGPELIDMVYDSLSEGVPVPIEWAALYDGVWTLHYSLVTGLDVPSDTVTVANPYGYVEQISIEEFLARTSFEAYEDMPLFLRFAFAFDIFEKNTVFIPNHL